MPNRYLRPYIAGPYTQGDPAVNTATALAVADKLLTLGYMPFLPHLSHYWHVRYPHDYETWMTYDRSWQLLCDCLIRLPGESSGADREVTLANQMGQPVFYGVEAFLNAEGIVSA
jgi:hypothetical protein